MFAGIACVTPYPTAIFAGKELKVNTWSAKSSIIATFIPFAHDPGFLAATVTPVIVEETHVEDYMDDTPQPNNFMN